MNKQLQMRYYHELIKTTPALAKTKAGRKMIMSEAFYMAKLHYHNGRFYGL